MTNDWLTINGGEAIDISDFFGLYGKFIIPAYQRSYEWKKKYCEDLFGMIEYSSNIKTDNRNFNYLGIITFIVKQNKEIEIIDGQQRLTSIFLLNLAIKKQVNSLKLYNDHDKNKISRIENSINKIIYKSFNIDDDSDEQRIKIFFDSYYDNIGKHDKNIIINKLISYSKTNKETRNLLGMFKVDKNTINKCYQRNFLVFVDKLNYSLGNLENKDKVNKILKLCISISKLKIGKIQIKNENFVNKYFEIINSKNQKLLQDSLIKNYIFSCFRNNKDNTLRVWNNTEKNWLMINDNNETDLYSYFVYYHFIKSGNIINKNDVFVSIKENYFMDTNKVNKLNEINCEMKKISNYLFDDKMKNPLYKGITSRGYNPSKKIQFIIKILNYLSNEKKSKRRFMNIIMLYIQCYINEVIDINDLCFLLLKTVGCVIKIFFFHEKSTQTPWNAIKKSIAKALLNNNINDAKLILRNAINDKPLTKKQIRNKKSTNINMWALFYHFLLLQKRLDEDLPLDNFVGKQVEHIYPLNCETNICNELKAKQTNIGNISLLSNISNSKKSNKRNIDSKLFSDDSYKDLWFIDIPHRENNSISFTIEMLNERTEKIINYLDKSELLGKLEE